MSYTNWYDAIKRHLEKYKTQVLTVHGSGCYAHEPYGHILPEGSEMKNFIGGAPDAGYKFHRCYYHLNSSQTMCYNFFRLMLKEHFRLLNQFLNKFIGGDIKIEDAQFEYVDDEFGDTNFDFYCRDSRKREYFFEIKYTENGFAKKCKPKKENNNDAYIHQVYENKYKPLVEKEGSLLNKDVFEELFMKRHYQAFRNICVANANEERYVIFITMNGNERTRKDLDAALNFLSERDTYVKDLSWEENVRQFIEKATLDDEEKKYYEKFFAKYLLSEKNEKTLP